MQLDQNGHHHKYKRRNHGSDNKGHRSLTAVNWRWKLSPAQRALWESYGADEAPFQSSLLESFGEQVETLT